MHTYTTATAQQQHSDSTATAQRRHGDGTSALSFGAASFSISSLTHASAARINTLGLHPHGERVLLLPDIDALHAVHQCIYIGIIMHSPIWHQAASFSHHPPLHILDAAQQPSPQLPHHLHHLRLEPLALLCIICCCRTLHACTQPHLPMHHHTGVTTETLKHTRTE